MVDLFFTPAWLALSGNILTLNHVAITWTVGTFVGHFLLLKHFGVPDDDEESILYLIWYFIALVGWPIIVLYVLFRWSTEPTNPGANALFGLVVSPAEKDGPIQTSAIQIVVCGIGLVISVLTIAGLVWPELNEWFASNVEQWVAALRRIIRQLHKDVVSV